MPRAFFLLAFALTSMTLTGPSLAQRASESVKVATFNAFFTTAFFNCFNPNFLDCIAQLDGRAEDWANELADAILSDPNRPDIIAINEAWDEDAKQILVDRLAGVARGKHPAADFPGGIHARRTGRVVQLGIQSSKFKVQR